jgi:predicted RNA-binding Zn-ribbon protein involved in translation (DUF1610 family)
MGKCPSCGTVLLTVNCAEVTVNVLMGKSWKGVKYFCPSCGSILSVAIDPIAIRTDIVEQIVNALARR